MKIFISWSGDRSRAVADLMSLWIKCVLQASRPWISTRDIDRGAVWFSEISDQLAETAAGIVCLTNENKNRPWILFETGALAKGLSTNRVCTFLVDLEPRDLQDPLAQFNHTLPQEASMWELVRTLNAGLDGQRLDERILDTVFKTYWPQFREKFDEVLLKHPAIENPAPRSDTDILHELLDHTRSVNQRVRQLEAAVSIPNRAVKVARTFKLPRSSNPIIAMVDQGKSDSEIMDYLCNEWNVAPSQAKAMLYDARHEIDQGLDLAG